MVSDSIKLDLFIGSRLGTFKHVKYNPSSKKKQKHTSRQLHNVNSIQKGEGITCASWGNREQTEIILGRQNRTLQHYSLLTEQYTNKKDIDFGEGLLHSIAVHEDIIIGAVESGIVKIWKSSDNTETIINTGGPLDRMRHCIYNPGVFGTGGKEHDLKLWDIEKNMTVFEAKNVPHDWLQLRVPIWISDLCFLPEGDGKVMAISSRYGVVRLYDARAQRRPVCSVENPGQANSCISLGSQDRHVLVGTGRGILNQVDLRNKGKLDKSYKGHTGSVTDALCMKDHGLVVSTSLDRHIRIHNAETKELIHKQYLTSKLTCFLVRTATERLPNDEEYDEKVEVKEELAEGIEVDLKEEGSDSEYEDMFQNMEVIRDGVDKKKKKKKKHQEINDEEICETTDQPTPSVSKKRKNKSENSKITVEDVQGGTPLSKKNKKSVGSEVAQPLSLDDSIKQLLKSTEKTKKKIEKKRKEKKAKSVFNN